MRKVRNMVLILIVLNLLGEVPHTLQMQNQGFRLFLRMWVRLIFYSSGIKNSFHQVPLKTVIQNVII